MDAPRPLHILLRHWMRFSAIGAAGLCFVVGAGFRCGSDTVRPVIASPVPGGPDAVLRQKIEELTGGHTRIVWARDLGPDKDPHASGADLVLMGLDTRMPSLSRVLTEERGNVSRPLLTPDGTTIVFSRRTPSGDPKVPDWSPEILTLPWEGGVPRALRPGYAVEVWSDPSTHQTWVYAFTSLRPGISFNPEGHRLFRFPLTQPDKEEVVWEQGMMSGDNIQLNRGGTVASGLIPWPNAGTFDFKSGQFTRYRNGCWPSLAPDDSGVVWVFDGSHQNLRFFLPGLDGNWRVPMDQAEGLQGKAAYHPRWSNHPRMITFTGPHNKSADQGHDKISVILARFNDSLTAIEESLSLRNSTAQPDCYPDVWVAGGEAVSLDLARVGPRRIRELAAAAALRPAAKWEVTPQGLCFVWERVNANNRIPAGQRECSVTPKRYARYGPRFDMLTEGGTFLVDPTSGAAIREAVVMGPWSMELAVTPLVTVNDVPQVIFSAGAGLEIQQKQHDFIIHCNGKEWQIGGGVSPERTTHLAFGSGPGRDDPPVVWINGQPQEVRPVEIINRPSLLPTVGQDVQFGARADGSAAWSGRLEAVTFHGAPFNSSQAATHAAWWKQKLTDDMPPARTVVRARLKEASPRATLDSLGTYRRSWTSALYEKITLQSGPDPGAIFGVAHWTILDAQPLQGLPGTAGEDYHLVLEPMTAHPEMDSEHGSEEVLPADIPMFLDASPVGP